MSTYQILPPLALVQEDPLLIVEIPEGLSLEQLELAGDHLLTHKWPDEMSVEYQGRVVPFHTVEDRLYFALGVVLTAEYLQKAT